MERPGDIVNVSKYIQEFDWRVHGAALEHQSQQRNQGNEETSCTIPLFKIRPFCSLLIIKHYVDNIVRPPSECRARHCLAQQDDGNVLRVLRPLNAPRCKSNDVSSYGEIQNYRTINYINWIGAKRDGEGKRRMYALCFSWILLSSCYSPIFVRITIKCSWSKKRPSDREGFLEKEYESAISPVTIRFKQKTSGTSWEISDQEMMIDTAVVHVARPARNHNNRSTPTVNHGQQGLYPEISCT